MYIGLHSKNGEPNFIPADWDNAYEKDGVKVVKYQDKEYIQFRDAQEKLNCIIEPPAKDGKMVLFLSIDDLINNKPLIDDVQYTDSSIGPVLEYNYFINTITSKINEYRTTNTNYNDKSNTTGGNEPRFIPTDWDNAYVKDGMKVVKYQDKEYVQFREAETRLGCIIRPPNDGVLKLYINISDKKPLIDDIKYIDSGIGPLIEYNYLKNTIKPKLNESMVLLGNVTFPENIINNIKVNDEGDKTIKNLGITYIPTSDIQEKLDCYFDLQQNTNKLVLYSTKSDYQNNAAPLLDAVPYYQSNIGPVVDYLYYLNSIKRALGIQ